jgi:flagellar assembly factor FliW
MQIQSSRFGWLSVDDDRVITFPRGLLGFPEHTRFALLPAAPPTAAAATGDQCFFWLQSADDPALAFVVADPAIFFKESAVPVREDAAAEVRMSDPARLQAFVICNKVGDWITGNLLGPVLVNAENRLATQVVLTERKWTTRQPLVRVRPAAVPLARSA